VTNSSVSLHSTANLVADLKRLETTGQWGESDVSHYPTEVLEEIVSQRW
jgi:hypothetical protein